MSRHTSTLLLLAGAALLVTWIAAPASSAPQAPLPAAPAPATVPDGPESGTEPEVESLHLSDRLSARPVYLPPTRDPFAFAPRSGPGPAPLTFPTASGDNGSPLSVRPPTLVAVVADTSTGEVVRRAVLASASGDVRLVSAGESAGGFVVSAVRPDGVTFTHELTGTVVTVALR
jgi:hypothetical protein